MEPDSSSNRESVWSFSAIFLERRMLNTEAASVEEITEPIIILSIQENPKHRWTKEPTNNAVNSTPRLESTKERASTGRAARILVPKPP